MEIAQPRREKTFRRFRGGDIAAGQKLPEERGNAQLRSKMVRDGISAGENAPLFFSRDTCHGRY